MTDATETITTFVQPVALTITLVYLYGVLAKSQQNKFRLELSLGLLFGVGVIASMMAPINVGEGFIIDLRNLLIASAIAFLGPLAGVIALITGVATRINIGGAGAIYGVAGMLVAGSMGYIWRHLFLNQGHRNLISLVMLGVMMSAHILVGLTIAEPQRSTFIFGLGPYLFALNVVGSVLLGVLFFREQALNIKIDELRTAATTDPLTSLMNRRSVISAVEEMQTDSKTVVSKVMLYFDLDNFKDVNDNYGHLAGDVVLKVISERIAACLRPNDLFSRLGGDEFVIVLPDVGRAIAEEIAERCRLAVCSSPIQIGDDSIDVTISMGATYSGSNQKFQNLLSTADDALYEAKREGRNRVALHESFLHEEAGIAA